MNGYTLRTHKLSSNDFVIVIHMPTHLEKLNWGVAPSLQGHCFYTDNLAMHLSQAQFVSLEFPLHPQHIKKYLTITPKLMGMRALGIR